jgi:hypothetical protein
MTKGVLLTPLSLDLGVIDIAESLLTLLSHLFELQKALHFFEDIFKPNSSMGELYCLRPLGPTVKKLGGQKLFFTQQSY